MLRATILGGAFLLLRILSAIRPARAVEQTRTYTRPSADMLTRSGSTATDPEYNPDSVLTILRAGGMPCTLASVDVGASAEVYHLNAQDAAAYGRRRKAAAFLSAKARVPCSVQASAQADLAVCIPRTQRRTVFLGDCYTDSGTLTTVALGQTPDGKAAVADLATMPHLLIAGATGSGKSVCLNSILASLLLRNDPGGLQLVLVDPKQVELSIYSGLPHLARPISTAPGDALDALEWACDEMNRRYAALRHQGVRSINDTRGRFPRLFLVIDELADLMLTSRSLKKEVESCIVRIAQLGRAAGVHLIVATQRPTTNVLTGLIKANIPARIAFAVASDTDSRVILDSGGAETLAGRGDGLFLCPDACGHVERFRAAYTPDEDIRRIVQSWT